MTAILEPVADKCRSCGAPIIWCVDEGTNNLIPVDVEPRPRGRLAIEYRQPPQAPLVRVVKARWRFARTDLHTTHFCASATSRRAA